MSVTMHTILSISLFVSSALAFNCSQPPIYIDIHKRIVHGTPVFQYGGFIGVGSPGQNQSLVPSLRHNETSFADSNFCSKSNLTDCSKSTHGNFIPKESSSWVQFDSPNTTDFDSVASSFVTGQDDVHIYTHFFETDPASEHVVNMPITVATSGNINPGIVGLGSSSTILHSLFDAGLIAARTFGLYTGSGMDRANGVVNGSLTFGGYDSGRFRGDVHSYDIDISTQDPFKVGIMDIIVDNPTGDRNVSLFTDSRFSSKQAITPFEARLSADEFPISLPSSLTQNFISLLNAKTTNLPDGSLALSSAANGSTMTFVLSDGYRMTLPSEVLYNVTGISPVAARDEKDSSPFTLGLSFMSQVYLMVDYDNYKFHLGDAVQKNNYVMPTTFCPKSIPKAYVAPNSGIFQKEGMVGAIVGGVIGGLGFLIAATVLVLVCMRKRQEKKADKEAEKRTGEKKQAAFQQFDVEDQSEPKKKKGPLVKVTMFGS